MFSLNFYRARSFFPVVLLCLLTGCDTEPQLKPLSTDAVILAFGDSLTYGTGATPEQSYPARLQALLSKTVINAGVPGEVSRSGLGRLPALLQQYRPELMLLCHGGNDILRRSRPEETRSNLQKMIELAQASGTQVVLIGVPQFGIFLSAAPFYRELAESNRLPAEIDTLSEILRRPDLKSDQIHPNSTGYALLAERLQQLLEQSGAI